MKSKVKVVCYVEEDEYKEWQNHLEVWHGVKKAGRYSNISAWNSLLFRKALNMFKEGIITIHEEELDKDQEEIV